ncbi:MAG TPA: histidine phosphatase family protein [Propionibacteriaceae bacterium]|nr:histidine phosphatase family protein [Propionibacteriaceae bacterium]
MRLILIRHGQTQSNLDHLLDTGHPGAPLTEAGLAQAATLVDRLADEPIEAVYSSDLTRARQTAEPLAASKGLSVTPHPGLREIFAGVDDMSDDWVPYVSVLDTWHTDPENKLVDGENWPEFQGRFDAAVAEIVASGVEVAALVSHGAALRVWIPFVCANTTAGDARHWRLDNTDIVVIEGDGRGWNLVSWADADLTALHTSVEVG